MKYTKGIAQKILDTIITRNLPTNHASGQCFVTCDDDSDVKEIIRFYHTKSRKRYSQVSFMPNTLLITKEKHESGRELCSAVLSFYSDYSSLNDVAKDISDTLCSYRKSNSV